MDKYNRSSVKPPEQLRKGIKKTSTTTTTIEKEKGNSSAVLRSSNKVRSSVPAKNKSQYDYDTSGTELRSSKRQGEFISNEERIFTLDPYLGPDENERRRRELEEERKRKEQERKLRASKRAAEEEARRKKLEEQERLRKLQEEEERRRMEEMARMQGMEGDVISYDDINDLIRGLNEELYKPEVVNPKSYDKIVLIFRILDDVSRKLVVRGIKHGCKTKEHEDRYNTVLAKTKMGEK